MTERSDTRAVGTYDPYWALLWQDWMTVLERGRRIDRTDVRNYCCRAGMVASPDPCPWHKGGK